VNSKEIDNTVSRVLSGDIDSFEALVRAHQEEVWKVERTTRFNSLLASTVQYINAARPDLRLLLVDIQQGLSDLILNPDAYGFTKTFPSALDDPVLADKSFTGPGKNYIFWDSLHPTSKTQSLIESWCFQTVMATALEDLSVASSGDQLTFQLRKLQIGRDYRIEQSHDLVTWGIVNTFTASAGTNQWPTLTSSTASFFRLRRE